MKITQLNFIIKHAQGPSKNKEERNEAKKHKKHTQTELNISDRQIL